MSLFERLGEKVEEFKQEAEDARDDSAPYLCRDCGERFHQAQKTCPACGSEQLAVRKDVAASEGDSASASDSESGAGPSPETDHSTDSTADFEEDSESDPADTPLEKSDDPGALITEAESEDTEQTDDGA
ncbi:small CPxCG-related zinc finger protein [Natrialba magadii ATCC 43099]|uniref:Small CPxCG-related zinc finger protein n=1 Tax=Natrialba magadii (strain ATCC 43099 / DSM 3394 / CCM 3739 / CIP 104546 / IAM 13178 / JCM 8861 / NBRC 102185 / NCIMB 2190 / MS3) TaxID=547559 RepID=D3SYM8_NATMM|nr:hypothetical protein [Natrialba magadii]ADD04139.1 small CPxCG-related zinc finger protein [Natrialba magadii ATCC 43099]ELY32924.1 hypothetical protein C500_03169 [Natrialba magadii ATCC 43099]